MVNVVLLRLSSPDQLLLPALGTSISEIPSLLTSWGIHLIAMTAIYILSQADVRLALEELQDVGNKRQTAYPNIFPITARAYNKVSLKKLLLKYQLYMFCNTKPEEFSIFAIPP